MLPRGPRIMYESNVIGSNVFRESVQLQAASKRNAPLSIVNTFCFIPNKISSVAHHLPVRNFRRANTLIKEEGESGKPKATRSRSGKRA